MKAPDNPSQSHFIGYHNDTAEGLLFRRYIVEGEQETRTSKHQEISEGHAAEAISVAKIRRYPALQEPVMGPLEPKSVIEPVKDLSHQTVTPR